MGRSTSAVVVLLVDSPGDVAATAAGLERAGDGLVVETASGAEAAQRRLDEGGVDCVVAGYDLPGQTGLDLFAAVRERYPGLPFVLFSGAASEAVAADALRAGVTDYVRRDADGDEYAVLAERVEAAVADRDAVAGRDQRLERIMQTVPGCVVQLDRDGDFVYANDHAEDELGLERRSPTDGTYVAPEWTVTDLDGDPLPPEERPFRRVMDTGEPVYGVRVGVEWPDGTRKVLTVNGAPLLDGDSRVESVILSITDSTAQLERERRLRETTAQLEALFEQSPDMINVHDADGNVLEPNERLCEETGYSKAELTDMKVWELDADIDPSQARSMWAELSEGDRVQLESEYERRDGSTFPVEVHVRRIDVDGESRFAVISRDVTERRDRERRLREATQQLQATIDAAPDAIIVVDEDGVVQEWNPAAERLFGWTAEEVVGERAPIVPEEAEAEFEARLKQVLDGDQITGFETQRRTKDGDRVDVSVSTALVENDGDAEGVVAIISDVTERKERERELRRQNERLEEFSKVVSHDLRNPMNVAVGKLELAREDCDSDHLDAVADAHDRMRALVDDLLSLARDGATVEDVGPVALDALAAECWRNVDTAGATLVVDTDRTVNADRGRLKQLLENLMRNAVEHGSTSPRSGTREDAVEHGSTSPASHARQDAVEHGSTSPRSHTHEDAVEHGSSAQEPQGGEGAPGRAASVTVTVGDAGSDGFYVADDGPGIPESDRDTVFEGGYTTAEDGTGFGLAIVEDIADAHGWTVDVTASEDGGARFDVRGVTTADPSPSPPA